MRKLLSMFVLYWTFSLGLHANTIFVERIEIDPDIEFGTTNLKFKNQTFSSQDRFSWAGAGRLKSALYDALDEIRYDQENETETDASDTNSKVSALVKRSDVSQETLFAHLKIESIVRYTSSLFPELTSHVQNDVVVTWSVSITDYQNNLVKLIEQIGTETSLRQSITDGSSRSLKIAESIVNEFLELTKDLEVATEKPKLIEFSDGKKIATNDALENSIALSRGGHAISGVIISTDGYALTDYRMFIGNHDEVNAYLSNGSTCAVELIRSDKVLNVALLKLVSNEPFDVLPVKRKGELDLDNQVQYFGTPGQLALKNTFALGYVAGQKIEEESRIYFIDTMPHWCYTGSGVFDAQGQFVGVAIGVSYDSNLNLVMPCFDFETLCSNLNIVLK